MKGIGSLLLLVAAGAFVHAAQAAGEHAGGHGKMEGQHGGQAMEHGQAGAHASRAGEPGKAAQATRTIDVEMSEFRFSPERLEVKAGETVLFRVRNTGKIEHEMVFGDAAELAAHAEEMRKQAGMAHDDSRGLTLDAGKKGELAWKFTNPGEFQYGCLVPGHYEAGMVGTVVVK